ncbi:MAG TPA: hypothetical protein VKV30_00205 [Candidatus Angelobacter sp.]|nr:hypothetical protein [Candidatus Angelobacter sp.]
MKIFLSLLPAGMLIFALGCGGHTTTTSGCTVVGLIVGPSAATVNHAASPPGNAQTFAAGSRFLGVCPSATAIPPNANWSVSDPSVHLSAAQGSSTTATCTGALASPVTVTATSTDGNLFMGTAALTCN